MIGWLDYLKLQVRSRTGVSQSVLVWAVVTVVCAAATFAFLLAAAFVWLGDLFGALVAALIMAGSFLIITLVALIGATLSDRRTAQRAQLELAARSNELWRDPKVMSVGLEIARAIGWRRLLPLAAMGILAATLAKEWGGGAKAAGLEDLDAREQARRDAA